MRVMFGCFFIASTINLRLRDVWAASVFADREGNFEPEAPGSRKTNVEGRKIKAVHSYTNLREPVRPTAGVGLGYLPAYPR